MNGLQEDGSDSRVLLIKLLWRKDFEKYEYRTELMKGSELLCGVHVFNKMSHNREMSCSPQED